MGHQEEDQQFANFQLLFIYAPSATPKLDVLFDPNQLIMLSVQ
jgi:hypothetical protein